MSKLFKRYLILILLCLPLIATFHEIPESYKTDPNPDYNNLFGREEKPNQIHAAGENMFLEYPSIDKQAFSPVSSPGFMDEVVLSAIPAIYFGYNFSVDAVPHSLDIGNSQNPSILYSNTSKNLFLFYIGGVMDFPYYNVSIKMIKSADNGSNWSEPKDIVEPEIIMGETATYRTPVAVEWAGIIHLIYRLNETMIYYMNSTDDGESWSLPRIIQQNNIPFYQRYFARIDMAVDPTTGNFHVAVATASGTDSNNAGIYFFNSTDQGDSWSVPTPIPLLGTDPYADPSLSFDSLGCAYLSAGNYTPSGKGNSFIAKFPSGLWGVADVYQMSNNYGPLYSTFDLTTNNIIVMNQTNNINHIWKITDLALGPFEKITEGPFASQFSSGNGFLFSRENKPFYVNTDSVKGFSSIAFEHITEPLDVVRQEGYAAPGDELVLKFDGKNDGRHSLDISKYYSFRIQLDVQNGSQQDGYTAFIERDDTLPSIFDTSYNSFISPAVEDGIFDALNFNFTADEDMEYNYKILQNSPRMIEESVVSGSLTGKSEPKIIMDESGRLFAFYIISMGGYSQLVYHVSENGGKSWSAAKSLTLSGYSNSEFGVYADKAGLYVFTEYQPYANHAVLRTLDGGETWLVTHLDLNLYPEKMAVSLNGAIYAVMHFGESEDARLLRSIDGGFSWTQVNDLPGRVYSFRDMRIDDVNSMLYMFYENTTKQELEIYSYNMNSAELKNKTICSFSSLEMLRGELHNAKILPAVSREGNSTLEFHLYMTPAPFMVEFYIETWHSTDNGSTWTIINAESVPNIDLDPHGFFYRASTNTSLHIEVHNIDYIDTIIVYGESQMVYRETDRLSRSDHEIIDYKGKDFNDAYLPQGNYTFQLTFWDIAKNQNSTNIVFSIDNQAPNIFNINWTTDPAHPLPQQNSTITFDVIDAENYLAVIEVRYKHSTTAWMSANCINIGDSKYEANFTGDPMSNRLDFYIKAIDLAGNVKIENNNGFYFGWEDPTIETLVVLLSEKTTTFDETPLNVIILNGGSYISEVFIATSFGQNVSCNFNGESYDGIVPKAPHLDSFSYNVIYRDLYNRTKIIYQNTHSRPFISVAKLEVPPINFEFTTADTLNFSVDFSLSYVPYIINVYISYRLDDGEWRNQSFTYIEGTGSYSTQIGPFENSKTIEFVLYYEDFSGVNEIEGTHLTLSIIPAMPELNLTTEQNLFIALIAAIAGLIVGTAYALILRSQQRNPQKMYADAYHAKNDKKSEGLTSKTLETKSDKKKSEQKPFGILTQPIFIYQPPPMKKSGIYTLLTIIIGISVGIYYYFSIQNYGTATAFSAILALFVTFFFESVLEIASESAIREPKKIYNARFASILFLSSTFVALASMFWIGSNIAWFNYYVYKDSVQVGRYMIPTLWISVAATYFTSMLLVVLTTQSSIRKYYPELQKIVQEGAGLYEIFKFRENRIISTKQQLMFKTLGFIAFVVISIIIATNLSRYTNLGLILLIPFLIGFLMPVLFFGNIKIKSTQLTPIQQKSFCGKCGKMIISGTYCGSCGSELSGEIVEISNALSCSQCQSLNSQDAAFCRICGKEFIKKT